MAAANENQGLKIAVAAFVTLTVVLAVTTYFGFSSYSEASAKLDEAEKKATAASQAASEALRNMEDLQRIAGYPNINDFAQLKTRVQTTQRELSEALVEMTGKVGQMLQAYRNAGGDDQAVERLANAAIEVSRQIEQEPNGTFLDTQKRMTQLVDSMTQLTTALVLDNQDLQTALRNIDIVNAQQLDVQVAAVNEAKTDLQDEHAKHEQERSTLVRQVGELQTLANQQQNEIGRLETLVAQDRDSFTRQRDQLLAQLRSWREQVEKDEDIMDVPDGRIVFVDYNRGEVRTTLGRRQGARERMQFSVFDRDSPGLPTDKPKAVVELIRVNETESIGRIVDTMTPSNPIRNSDHVYSAAWSANRPKRFALVGKMDISRDGSDDREDLKRLIRQAGGIIDYDLPPPEVGLESGEVTGATTFYVLDDREPLRPSLNRAGDFPGTLTAEWLQKKSNALQAAQQNGVRPISVESLLAYLGYTYGQSAPGGVEAIDQSAVDELLNRGNRPAAPINGRSSNDF